MLDIANESESPLIRTPGPHTPLQVLILSYYFPPVAEVASLRMGRLCRYLPEWDIHPLVVTVEEQERKRQDPSIPVPPHVHVERTRVMRTPLDIYSSWRKRRSNSAEGGDASMRQAGSGRRAGPIKRNLAALLQMPDPYWGWYGPALRAAEKLLAHEHIVAILSSGPPWTPHLVARRLRKKYGLPWFADFRDPWAYDPFREDFPAWGHWLNRRMEANCIGWADRVLCNTDRLRQFFVDQYPRWGADKFLTLPNGFDDPVTFPAKVGRTDHRKLLIHVGWLYARRRIDTFCEAVASLVRSGKLNPETFRIVFLGDAAPTLIEAAKAKAPELVQSGCIEFRPRVTWLQAQETLWSADVLLLFQGYFRLQTPAKFFEYLPTGKPIFAVVKQGALSDTLEATESGLWADTDNPVQIAERFLEVLNRPALPPHEVQQRWFKQYHYRALSERLAGWIREVVEASSSTRRGTPKVE